MLLCLFTLPHFIFIALLYYASFILHSTLYFILLSFILFILYCSVHNSIVCASVWLLLPHVPRRRWGLEQSTSFVSSFLYFHLLPIHLIFTIVFCNRLAIININAIDWTTTLALLKGLRRRDIIDFHQCDLSSSLHRGSNARLLHL